MTDKKEIVVAELTLDQAIEFFALCEVRGANTPEEKQAIFVEMIQKKKVERAWTTCRTKEQILEDMAREHTVIVPDEDGKLKPYKEGEEGKNEHK